MMDSEELHSLFTVAISQDHGSTLVSFVGELDIVAAPAMRQVFLDPEIAGAPRVKVDMERVTFFDSSALGVVIAACRRVKEKEGGEFSVICSGAGVVRSILTISGLIDYLQVVDGI